MIALHCKYWRRRVLLDEKVAVFVSRSPKHSKDLFSKFVIVCKLIWFLTFMTYQTIRTYCSYTIYARYLTHRVHWNMPLQYSSVAYLGTFHFSREMSAIFRLKAAIGNIYDHVKKIVVVQWGSHRPPTPGIQHCSSLTEPFFRLKINKCIQHLLINELKWMSK